MNNDENEANEDEKDTDKEKETAPVKREHSISPVDIPININVPSVSAPLIDDTEIIAPDLNIDADIDMLHNSVSFIDENDFNDIAQDDELLIERPELQHELHKEIYPTITSVTSLHPEFRFNEIIHYEPNPLDSSNTTIL